LPPWSFPARRPSSPHSVCSARAFLFADWRPISNCCFWPDSPQERREAAEGIERVRRAVSDGPRTPFEIVPDLIGRANLEPMVVNWALSQVLSYLRHLELREEVRRLDGADPARWELAKAA
jgi:hypothetical protein